MLQARTEIGISRIQNFQGIDLHDLSSHTNVPPRISRIQISLSHGDLMPVSAVIQARTEIGISRIQTWIPDCQH